MRLLFLSLSVLFFSTISCAADSPDLTKLQGTWKLVSLESAGRKIPDAYLQTHGFTRVIKGDTLTEIRQGHENEPDRYSIKLDDTKSPKEIDLTDKDPDPGQKPNISLAIYKLDGEQLH